jgi:ClpP class serine protease
MNFFKSGDLKGAGLDFKPLTAEEAAMFQSRVTSLGKMFRSAVTAKRPQVSKGTMQGQSFYGFAPGDDDALSVGLLDARVESLAEVLAQLR